VAKIDITDTVSYPRDIVWSCFRDDLKKLVPYLPNIRDIEVEKHERVDEDTVEVVNIWKAADEDIPKMARKFIDPERLQWTDYATWHDDTHDCDWEMEVNFLQDAVTCKGTTSYREENGSTRVHIQGELRVDAKQIPGVPRMLAGKVGDTIEKFVVRLVTPNLTEVNRGAEQYLDKQDAED
jgi:hypothetical protein